jgi:BMFP domain-containing protein YqiC
MKIISAKFKNAAATAEMKKIRDVVTQALKDGNLEFDVADDSLAGSLKERLDALEARLAKLEGKAPKQTRVNAIELAKGGNN